MEKLLKLLGIAMIISSSVFALCDDESSDDDKSCRTYATVYTTSHDGVSYTCAFNTTTFRYECEGDDGSIMYRQYDSISRFINEAKAVGRIFNTEDYTETSGGDIQHYIYQFDAADPDQLVTRTQHKDSDEYPFTYTSHDSSKRPTAGTADYSDANASCSDMPVEITYDDAARTKVESTSVSNKVSVCAPFVWTRTDTYDINGDLVRIQVSNTGLDINITVTETATICE